MVLRSTYLNILFWVALIVLNSLLLSWLIVNHFTIDLILISLILLIIITYFFIRFLNRINRRLTFFFQSLNSDDSSFRISEEPNDKIEKELFESLNQISRKIEGIRIKAQEQELQFQAVVEQSNSGLLAFDEQGIIHITNSAASQLLQCEVLTHIKQLKRVNETLYSIILNIKQNETKTVSILENKNQRVLSIKASSFKLRNNLLILLSITDIKPELDARETDSWIKLTRVLTHEIMNGIAPVTSIAKTVTSYFEKDGEIVKPNSINEQLILKAIKGLNIVHQQSIGLMNFVEHFRKFSKIPQPALKEILIHEFIERIGLASQDIIQKANATFLVEIIGEKMTLMADENLLAQVMTILVSNAADAVSDKPNGTIQIKVHPTESGKVCIEIEDNGIGISPEILDEIFTPFFSTKPNGTGIGLSIARQIIHMHGGRFEVHSILNKGSSFRILL
ncbi:MAG: GHKL domain-containing protein [Bacteroidales bacterium]|nr:MAG: GHKL domain-containing protein [Bacteroidales bacterium]